jgi:FtsH-binding integral membrane protein
MPIAPSLFWPLFLFLTATVVAVFTFISVLHWITSQSQERQARERYALFKALAEMPGENAGRILDQMAEQDRAKARKARAEQLMGGLVTLAVGISLSVMLVALSHDDPGVWTVGLIPGAVGAVLVVFNLFTKGDKGPGRASPPRA